LPLPLLVDASSFTQSSRSVPPSSVFNTSLETTRRREIKFKKR
jgi:hypothetical protein